MLQHVSTLTGLGILAWWCTRWILRAKELEIHSPVRFGTKTRVLAWSFLVASVTLSALWYAVLRHNPEAGYTPRAITIFAFRALFAGVLVGVVDVILFSIGWQVAARRSIDAADAGSDCCM